MADSDDEEPVLSSSALDALKEFYADRDARLKKFEDLKASAEDEHVASPGGEGPVNLLSMDAFAEDWNESQFWYSDETAIILAEQLLEGAGPNISIAVISAPSVFVQLKNILTQNPLPADQKPKIYLLEYDERFAVFPEFVFYDFKNPIKLPPELQSTINHIICDPPFLSEDCQTKAALTVRWLSKSWGVAAPTPTSSSAQIPVPTSTTTSTFPAAQSKLILCTGERMSTLITKIYRPQGIQITTFLPVHSNGLSNEFFCYANFECGVWGFRDGELEEKDVKDDRS